MRSGNAKLFGRTTLAVSLLAAALLAGCGGTQEEQGSEGGQGSREEQQTTAAPSGGSATQASQGETTSAMSADSTTAQGGEATPGVVAATERFLATLDDAQREQATFAFDDPLKSSNWSNLPAPIVQRSGAYFGDMTEEQQQAAMEVLEAALSEEGYQKTVGIMAADQALANSEGGASDGGTQGDAPPGGGLQFGIDQYVVAIFGTPSETEPWTFQFGGHHLGLNLTVAGEDDVITPSFVGVQPSEFTLDEAGDLPSFVPTDLLGGGTVRPMAEENDLAFELLNSLDAQQQEEAILDYQVSDLVLGPGEDGRQLEPEGLPASEMSPEEQDLLLDLAREWVGIVDEGVAERRMSEIRDNLDETYFAWSGPTTNGESVYYRITGPTLHIEFAHQALAPGGYLHIHSVYRNPTDEYGQAVTPETVSAQQYAQQ